MLAGDTIPTSQERKEGETVADAKATGAAIKEKVEAEASAAEVEEPETETPEPAVPDEGDDEDPEVQEPAPAEEPTGRRQKSPQEQFEAAFQRFRTKVAAIFEVPVQEVQPAPHPGVVGIMLPGFAEPKTHSNYKRCETCNGLGKVLTEAQTGDPAKDWHVCPDTRCKGQGYWTKNSAVEQAPQTGPLAVQPLTEANGEFAEAPTWLGDPSLTPAA